MTRSNLGNGYLQEKGMRTLKGIAAIVDTLNSARGLMPTNTFTELQADLFATLSHSIKVVAVLNCVIEKADHSDVELIISSGTKGLDRVLFKYGCSPETDEMIRERLRPAFARRLLQLSKGDRTSRNAIYYECQKFGRDELTDHIDILLEGVTQNTKEWSQFQLEMEHFLSPLCREQAPSSPLGLQQTPYFG